MRFRLKSHKNLMELFVFGFVFIELSVFSVETFNPAGGVHQLLFPGKERMTGGTNFHADVFFGGAGRNFVATSATNVGFVVIRMNSVFHFR